MSDSAKVFLITGATGSLGTLLTQQILSQGHKVRAYARNEHGHEKLIQSLPSEARPRLASCIGAVEDLPRLHRAMAGVDYVIHAAAMKVIGLCEYSPAEAVKTNILGTQNVVDACIDAGVERAVFISSDKAAASVNHYGHTKAAGEKLWLHGNHYSPEHQPFVAVRYGNCWASQGSVFHVFKEQAATGQLTVTDPEATRFHWMLGDAVDFVMKALFGAQPGEMWVPMLPAYKMDDLAKAFAVVKGLREPYKVIGLRPGEKRHESMIAEDEGFMSTRKDKHFVITPGRSAKEPISTGYHSSTPWRMSRQELVGLIEETLNG